MRARRSAPHSQHRSATPLAANHRTRSLPSHPRLRAGGGAISLDHVTFEDNDLCYKLDDHVTRRAAPRARGERLAPPKRRRSPPAPLLPLSRPAQVTGRAADCRVDGALFGRWHKPAGFRCKRTTYADDDLTDHEDDSDDSDAGDVGGSTAVG